VQSGCKENSWSNHGKLRVGSSVELCKGGWEEMAIQLVKSWTLQGRRRRDGATASWELKVWLCRKELAARVGLWKEDYVCAVVTVKLL
jgi:hypothetical protein